jgi:outer membrane lipoprotein-sorting protein
MISAWITTALLTLAPDPSALLEQVDKAASRAADASMKLSVDVTTKDGDTVSRELMVWQLGQQKRMVKFTAPARLRGTGILVDSGKTWLYTAAYKRVRRVAGKAGGGSWMGTGFSINDLARTRFARDYTAAIESSDEAHWVLRLTPKDPGAHDRSGLRIKVRKADHLVARIDTLTADGTARRTILADDFKSVGAYKLAHRIRIQDPVAGKTTTARITDVRFDTGLTASWFSERQLRRSP